MKAKSIRDDGIERWFDRWWLWWGQRKSYNSTQWNGFSLVMNTQYSLNDSTLLILVHPNAHQNQDQLITLDESESLLFPIAIVLV